MSLLADVMEELGLGDVDDLEGNSELGELGHFKLS